ncbi:MAG: histidine phosphatase family protein [Phycisphaerales bacterium]|nr:histidine phosphatase family protein [Phycisphaerales bacterium]
MRTLILMRHAKAQSPTPSTDDHDRQLAPRGQRAAEAMAHWMEATGHRPDKAICSTAARAHETARIVCATLAQAPPTAIPDLYMPTSDDIFTAIAGSDARSLLVVSHNPTCESFVHHTTGAFEVMPTASVAVIRFDVDEWSDSLLTRSGSLEALQRPRDLG